MRRFSPFLYLCILGLISLAAYGVTMMWHERAARRRLQLEQEVRLTQMEFNLQAVKDAALAVRVLPQAGAATSPRPASDKGTEGQQRRDTTATPPAPEPEPSTEELRDALEVRFNDEAPDRSWSAQAAQEARAQVDAHLPADSRVLGVDCRTTLCRVETSHRSLENYRNFLTASFLSSEFEWQGPVMATILREESSGGVVSVAYLTRPGSAPPYDTVRGGGLR
jgi:hypothetical protein